MTGAAIIVRKSLTRMSLVRLKMKVRMIITIVMKMNMKIVNVKMNVKMNKITTIYIEHQRQCYEFNKFDRI